MFVPFNFHDRDPSRKSAQGVQLKLGNETKVRVFGYYHTKDEPQVSLFHVSMTLADCLGYNRGKP